MLTRALALLTAVVWFASGGAVSATAATTPIRHVVVIFDENVSFDHYFGTYPNAANPPGQPAFTPAPGTPAISGLSGALLTANPNGVNPFRLDRTQAVTCDNDHSYTDEQRAFDGGLMDKFTAVVSCGGAASTGMGYYDGNTVTALWNYAQHYAMSDAHFGTTFGPSTPGALNLISGQTHPPAGATLISDPDPAGDDCGAGAATFGAAPNIGTLLSGIGVTWGWFQGGFRPTSVSGGVASCNASHQNVSGATVRDYSPHHEPFQYYDQTRNPHHKAPSSVAAIGHDEAGVNHQYDLSDYFAALDAGTPPAVSFLKAPAYQDGHAGYSDPLDEQRFLVDTVNRIQASSTWGDTAIVITYDDSDGWYDHQPSPIVNSSSGPDDALDGPGQCHGSSFPPMVGGFSNRCGFGPRLPLLVVSPYAKVNHVDHTQIDQTSVLRFIEDNWGTGQLGGGSFDDIPSPKPTIAGLFDFGRATPTAPLRLDPDTGQPAVASPPATPPVPAPALTTITPSTAVTPTTPTGPARRAARRLTVKVKHARDRRAPFTFALSGALTPPAGLAKNQACRGSVTVVIKAGARTVLRRRAKLHAGCRWSLHATFKQRRGLGHGHLTVRVRFAGNPLIRPRSAKTLHLRAG